MFDYSLPYGQKAEGSVEFRGIRRGWSRLSSSWREGKQASSPRFEWQGITYVHLPQIDLLMEKDETPIWMECKRKDEWVRFAGEVRIGFGRDAFRKYQQIQEITGIPVAVFFVIDEEPGKIFWILLDDFDEHKKPWIGNLDYEILKCGETCWYVERKHLMEWR